MIDEQTLMNVALVGWIVATYFTAKLLNGKFF